MRILQLHICLLLLGSILSGCGSAVPQETRRFFFPPPPVEPKIEYISSYFTTQDIKPREKSFATEFILGEERPQPLFSTPVDVVSDSQGRVYVTDMGAHQVVVLDTLRHERRTLRQSGSAAQFTAPYGLAVDASGRVYVSDVISRTITVFDNDEQFLFVMKPPDLERPTGMTVDDANQRLYVADTPSHRVAMLDLDGNLIGFIGERGSEEGQFNYPTDVDVDRNGNLYVMDSMNARVEVFNTQGKYLRSFGERGTAEGSFSIAKNLALSNTGQVYVTDSLEHKLIIFDLDGRLLLRIGSKSTVQGGVSPGGFYLPRGLDVDKNGAIWIVDTLNRGIHHFQYLTPEYLHAHPVKNQR